MLAKKYRLHNSSDIKQVFLTNNSLYSSHFRLLYRESKDGMNAMCEDRTNKSTGVKEKISSSRTSSVINNALFTVIISKKISKAATIRNKLKRRIWAIWANNSLVNQPGLQVVLQVKPGANELPFSELQLELNQLFAKLANQVTT